MRVLHLLYEPRRSGVSQHVISLVRSLPQHEHRVILPEGLAGVERDLVGLGAEVEVVPMRSRILPRSALRKLPARIQEVRPDLVHVHSLEAGGFGALAARLAGASRRVVFTPQTIEIRRRAFRDPFLRVVSRLGRRHAAWVGVSHGQVETLARWGPPGRVHWAPNAAPPVEALPDPAEARARLGWPIEGPIVVCVGRLAVQKDPWTFVRAVRRLEPSVRAVMVGEGPLRSELVAGLRASPNLSLAGFVSEMRDVYAAATVVCLPSRWEGLPYSLLEALSHGLPVVASRIDGNVDLVRERATGLLFTPGDAGELASALGAVLQDPALGKRLGEAGRRLVLEEFSEEAAGRRLNEVYELALTSATA